MEFKEKLKELRHMYGYSTKDLGDKAGMSSRTIERYEAGDRNPSSEMALRLAKVFNISVEELLGNDDILNAHDYAMQNTEKIKAMFMGGKVSPEDRKQILDIIQEAYYESVISEKLNDEK